MMRERIRKLCRTVNVEDAPSFVLFLGAVSTAGGGLWLWIQNGILRSVRPLYCVPVLRAGLEELALSALLHGIAAAILALDRKTRGAP